MKKKVVALFMAATMIASLAGCAKTADTATTTTDATATEETKEEVAYILDNLYQVEKYLEIDFPKRVVHADAKISNFLFNNDNHYYYHNYF